MDGVLFAANTPRFLKQQPVVQLDFFDTQGK